MRVQVTLGQLIWPFLRRCKCFEILALHVSYLEIDSVIDTAFSFFLNSRNVLIQPQLQLGKGCLLSKKPQKRNVHIFWNY